MADRSASAVWQGDLLAGGGTVSATTSGLFTDAAVTWPARTASADGRTSPEELIAAAHAACFSMALSHELSGKGTTPTSVSVEATVTFEPPTITKVALVVSAVVPGADQDAFDAAVAAAENGCPVSNALRGNVAISVSATLAAAAGPS